MKRKVLWKRILVINSLLMVLAVAVYAWFAMWDHAGVSSLLMQSDEAGFIQISQDGGQTFHDNLTLNLGESTALGELSGNGLTFYQPNYGMSGIDGYKLYTESELYLEETFVLRTDRTQSIYLTKNSFVAPADLQGNTSAYGDYSRDYIAGAIRVGFYEVPENGTPQLIYIWVPNSQYEFLGSGVTTEGTAESAYTYQIGPSLQQIATVETGGEANGVSADGNFVWGALNQQAVKPLLSFTAENGAVVQKNLMVRIWLEGSDRECVRQLHNGKFRVYLDFHSDKEGMGNG